MTATKASLEISSMLRLFQMLAYKPEVLDTWRRIVLELGVSGKQTHDAHLVAMMQVHSVRTILTFNVPHFARYPEIDVIDPADV